MQLVSVVVSELMWAIPAARQFALVRLFLDEAHPLIPTH